MPGFASLLAASAAVRASPRSTCAPTNICCCSRGRGEIASVSRLSRDPADSSLWQLGAALSRQPRRPRKRLEDQRPTC